MSTAGNTLRVTAAPGEVNAVEVSPGALGTLTVRDTGTDPAPPAPAPPPWTWAR